MTASTPDASVNDDELAAAGAGRGAQAASSQRDPDAFARLYDRHARSVLAFLAGRVRSADVEDLAQEVWRRAWARLDAFTGGNFRAWVFEIARNLVVDHHRRRRPEALGDGEEALVDGRGGLVDDRLIDLERREALRRCLESLPDDQAAIVRARLAGEDYDRCCERLGVPAARAHSLFHKAKNRLKDCLEGARV